MIQVNNLSEFITAMSSSEDFEININSDIDFTNLTSSLNTTGQNRTVYCNNHILSNLSVSIGRCNFNNGQILNILNTDNYDVFSYCTFKYCTLSGVCVRLQSTGENSKIEFENCYINIKCKYLTYTTNSTYTVHFKNCYISNTIEVLAQSYASFTSCYFDCNLTKNNAFKLSFTDCCLNFTYSGTTAITLNSESTLTPTIYNSDKITNVNTNSTAISCTDSQMKNAEYLESIGFNIAT